MVNTNIHDKYFRVQRAMRIMNEVYGRCTTASAGLPGWKFAEGDFRGPEIPGYDLSSWELLSEGADTYGGYANYFWLVREVEIPQRMAGQPVRFHARTAPYAGWDDTNPNFTVFIDGSLVSALDRNHTEFLLTPSAEAGKKYYIALKGYCEAAEKGLMFSSYIASYDPEIEEFYYDVKVPIDVWEYLDDGFGPKNEIEYIVDRTVNMIDLRAPGSKEFYESVKQAKEYMQREFYQKLCDKEPQVLAQCIGHTHLDVAWLWRMKQTREKTARTFANMLKFMEEYPDFKFMSSQACIYEWIKQDHPELYERLKQAVKDGRWEVEGGMWVEADCNLTSGEGFVRQFLYGKRFFKEEFGVDCRILWLPDVFGYSSALPQILKKSGMDYFMTTKISWNNHDKMPMDTFMWEGLDGSEVFSHFITCGDYLNARSGNSFTTYNGNLNPNQIMGSWERFTHKDICNEVLCSVGWGDGGGGTDRQMLENGKRMAKGIPGVPKVRFEAAGNYFKKWSKELENNPFLPKWVGELYLEFHRGTLTSQAKNKRNNRKSEFLYEKAELLSVMDSLLLSGDYPKALFDKNWKRILTNQFHDILPGSSIHQVYEDSDREYAEILSDGNAVADGKLGELVAAAKRDSDSVVVFNDTGVDGRDDIVSVEGSIYVKDIPSQSSQGKTWFAAKGVPSKGWRSFELSDKIIDAKPTLKLENGVYESPFYRFVLDENGELSSLVEKSVGIELCEKGKTLNHVVAYVDRPYDHDAWEVAPYYTEQGYIPETLSCELVENGPVFARFRTERRYCASSMRFDMYIYRDIPRIDIVTEADWQDEHTLLRAHFPTTVQTNHATYDTQFGTLERENNRNTSWEFSKFEVCGHKFADISDSGYGLAVLNDCKYGYACLGGDLSISLLRCPTAPDPMADKGAHRFTYSIMPHVGNYAEGGVTRQAYGLNCPLEAVLGGANPDGLLPSEYSFVSCDSSNVAIGAVKRAEDDGRVIVRLNEQTNSRTDTTVRFGFDVEAVEVVSLMEDEVYQTLAPEKRSVELTLRPFDIVTLRITPAK